MSLNKNLEENLINCFISNPDFLQQEEGKCSHNLDLITNLQGFHQYITKTKIHSTLLSTFPAISMIEWGSKVVEIFPKNPLNINFALSPE